MTYSEAAAAFAIAQAAGDVPAMLEAAQAMAAASAPVAPVKAARKPRAAKSDRPDWFDAVAKSKRPAQHSLCVTFADGQAVRVNAWQDPGKPIAVGKALRIAVGFYRARLQAYTAAVPDFTSVSLVDGATFDPAECTALSGDMRAAVPMPAKESAADRVARLERRLADSEALAARRREALEAEQARKVRLLRAWMRSEGTERLSIEGALATVGVQAGYDLATVERDIAACHEWIADAQGHAAPAAPEPAAIPEPAAHAVPEESSAPVQMDRAGPRVGEPAPCEGATCPGALACGIAVDDDRATARAEMDALQAVECEALEAAYPDCDDTAVGEPEGPMVAGEADPTFAAIASSHRSGEKLLNLARAYNGRIVSDRWKDTRVEFRMAELDPIRAGQFRGIRITGLPRKPRSGRVAPRPAVEAARARLAALQASRPLPLPDAGRPYQPRPRIRVPAGSSPIEMRAEKPRIRVKAGSRPSAWRPETHVGASPVAVSAWIGGMLAKARARRADATTLAAPGRPIRFVKASGWRALAGIDMAKPDGFRLTFLDPNGEPSGHSECPTLAEAADRALVAGYAPIGVSRCHLRLIEPMALAA